ncbi:MAG TPA: hypothetical protein VMN38_02405 [Sphingomicrobium sp.]|nr:hypothetical protein [Sphingomicrobium sp.]
MISEMITQCIQDELKNKYPAFGMWLFGSELAVVSGVLFVAAGEEGAVWLLIYGMAVGLLFWRYLRKHVAKPVPGDLIALLCSLILLAAFVIAFVLKIVFHAQLSGPRDDADFVVNGVEFNTMGGYGDYDEEGLTERDALDDWALDNTTLQTNDLDQPANSAAE